MKQTHKGKKNRAAFMPPQTFEETSEKFSGSDAEQIAGFLKQWGIDLRLKPVNYEGTRGDDDS